MGGMRSGSKAYQVSMVIKSMVCCSLDYNASLVRYEQAMKHLHAIKSTFYRQLALPLSFNALLIVCHL